MCFLVLFLLPAGAAATSSTSTTPFAADADPATVLSLLVVALIFVGVGVLSVTRQCRSLANQINNKNAEEDGGGGGTSRSYQKLVADLKSLREEHRTNQSEVKAELRTDIGALKGLQSDMAAQMVEIRSMVEKLAGAQHHVKGD